MRVRMERRFIEATSEPTGDVLSATQCTWQGSGSEPVRRAWFLVPSEAQGYCLNTSGVSFATYHCGSF